MAYGDDLVVIQFKNEDNNDLDLGKVLLSRVGRELAPLALGDTVDGFREYVLERWVKEGVAVWSPFPRQKAEYRTPVEGKTSA